MPSNVRRILILSNFFAEGHGGTPESVLLLARELGGLGISVDVFCNKGLLRDVHSQQALPAAAAEGFFTRAPDIGSYAALFVAGSWNRRAPRLALSAALKSIPVIYAAKGCLCRIEFERLRDLRRVPYFLLVEWLLLALARRIIFSSRAEQDASILPRWLWRNRALTLPEPFWGNGAAEYPPEAGRVPTLGFLAEISSRKGLYELIEGLGHYLAMRPGAPLRLKIAGSARKGSEEYFERCRSLARRNGAAAHIEWHAAMRGVQRDDFYRSLDVFVCPSRFESFGLTPLEALWRGVAVCVAPQMGVLEYLQPDAPVLRLAGLGKEEMARSLGEVADHVETWRSKGRAWRGRQALAVANRKIAQEFARALLGSEAI